MKPGERCVYCAYVVELREGRSARVFSGPGSISLAGTKTSRGKHAQYVDIAPAPLAVEVVETPNGPRALCAEHARDAVRA